MLLATYIMFALFADAFLIPLFISAGLQPPAASPAVMNIRRLRRRQHIFATYTHQHHIIFPRNEYLCKNTNQNT